MVARLTMYWVHVKFVCFPSQRNTWTTANRTLRFSIASSDFLDMESLRLGMTVYNTTTVTATGADVALEPIGPARAMFSRLRLFVSGALVEDIAEVGTLTCMLERLKNSGR